LRLTDTLLQQLPSADDPAVLEVKFYKAVAAKELMLLVKDEETKSASQKAWTDLLNATKSQKIIDENSASRIQTAHEELERMSKLILPPASKAL
jgi:hypothetical protein